MSKETTVSDKSAQFYNNLSSGVESRGVFGIDQRFNIDQTIHKKSVDKYFTNIVKKHIKPTDKVLDMGCGPGAFLAIVSRFCHEIIGVDISSEFVKRCQGLIQERNITNAESLLVSSDSLPFDDESFDVLILMDVIHHLESPSKTMDEAIRVLKKGGKVIIFEPNKLNPLLAIMHWIDPNERGLLKFGSPSRYRKLLEPKNIIIEDLDFNGIVIGPTSRLFDTLSSLLNARIFKGSLAWLNPKIFICGIKK